SQINIENVARLTKAGKKQPPGLAQVEAAKADGRWERAYGMTTTKAAGRSPRRDPRRPEGAGHLRDALRPKSFCPDVQDGEHEDSGGAREENRGVRSDAAQRGDDPPASESRSAEGGAESAQEIGFGERVIRSRISAPAVVSRR